MAGDATVIDGMQRRGEPVARERRSSRFPVRRMHLYDAALVALVVGLSVVVASTVYRGEEVIALSSPLAIAIATSALFVSLAATFFALDEFILYGSATSLCVAFAFLTLAGAEATMSFVPILFGHPSEVTFAPYGWGLVRLASGGLLIYGALIEAYQVPGYRRARLAVAGGFVLIGAMCVVAIWVYTSPGVAVNAPLAESMQFTSAILFGLASIGFWRAFKGSARNWFAWLSMSLCIASFSQLLFGLHLARPGAVQAGDVLQLLFFLGILLALTGEWSRNYRRLRWQARELEALNALTDAPVLDDVQAVVQHVIQVAGDTFRMDVHVSLNPGEHQSPADSIGVEMAYLEPPSSQSNVDESRRIIVGVDGSREGRVTLGVPLVAAGRRLGMLIVAGEPGAEFTAHDVRLLRQFGAQTSVLLERSLLYEEVAAGAVLAERSRLAREIHDGLAQHLAFLKMRVGWLKRSPAAVDGAQLADIESVLETALIEARHAITTLRAQPEAASTADAVKDYAAEFEQVSGLATEVIIDRGVPDVGPKARAEMLRIVQEALNNVRKHANASNIIVHLVHRSPGLEVRIRDNGKGFKIDEEHAGHFGLEIMRERAESVGGLLSVHSELGRGTEVRVWMPGAETDTALRLAAGT